ncbi:MAG TPA: DUF2937 family protein [Alphaproteobacteria bacterium]
MPTRVGGVLRSIADGLGAVVGAALLSQAPEFAQQYVQRLGGHRDEAMQFVEMLRARGATAPDAMLAAAEARLEILNNALNAVLGAEDLLRPLVLLRHLESEIAIATMEAFRPAVPLTPAGLAYAGIGLILGLILVNIVIAPMNWFWKWRKHA